MNRATMSVKWYGESKMTKRVTITDKDLLKIERGGPTLRFFFRSSSHPYIENITTYRNGKWSCDCGDYMFGSPHDCVHIKYIKQKDRP